MIEQNIINQGRELRVAIMDEDFETAKDLIKSIGVNTYTDATTNPFILASINQKTELVKYCLENGADTNLLYWPNYKFSPIMRQDESCSMLGYACNLGNLELVKLLLTHNADPNFINNAGISILEKFDVSSADRVQILKLLIEHGANLNTPMTSNNNQTFLEKITEWEIEDLLYLVNTFK